MNTPPKTPGEAAYLSYGIPYGWQHLGGFDRQKWEETAQAAIDWHEAQKQATAPPPKTKRVSYYIDLWPGWQDGEFKPCVFCFDQAMEPIPNSKRLEIIVDLPCISNVTETIRAEVRG